MKLTADRIGKKVYVLGNWAVMFGLILLYQFTPFKIEWVGLIVIGVYMAVYVLLFSRRKLLLTTD
jgi:glycine betaine transporter